MGKKNKHYVSKVYVDTRENKMVDKSLVFFKNQGINAVKHANKDGDLILVLNNKEKLYIERKSISDFASSYISGHIQDQALRLSNYQFRVCIVHGNITDLKRVKVLSRINQNSINKMASTLMMVYRLPIFFVDDEKQYLSLSLTIGDAVYKNMDKMLDDSNPMIKRNTSPALSIMRSGNNIGITTAVTLLKEFGSPKNILYASREDLLDVKGVGDSMVKNILELRRAFEGDDK